MVVADILAVDPRPLDPDVPAGRQPGQRPGPVHPRRGRCGSPAGRTTCSPSTTNGRGSSRATASRPSSTSSSATPSPAGCAALTERAAWSAHRSSPGPARREAVAAEHRAGRLVAAERGDGEQQRTGRPGGQLHRPDGLVVEDVARPVQAVLRVAQVLDRLEDLQGPVGLAHRPQRQGEFGATRRRSPTGWGRRSARRGRGPRSGPSPPRSAPWPRRRSARRRAPGSTSPSSSGPCRGTARGAGGSRAAARPPPTPSRAAALRAARRWRARSAARGGWTNCRSAARR